MINKITEKQKRFADYYLELGNGTQAAIKANYSERTAAEQAARLLTNANVRAYIDERLKQLDDERIATAAEVLKYITSVLRGESESEVVVVEGTGDGCSSASHIQKKPDEKERLKAAELLGRRYGIFTDKVNIEGILPVVIVDDVNE